MTPRPDRPEDQRAVIAWLGDAAVQGAPVERVTTHISELFLIGARVYKLKRAVRFAYLDFSTAAQRRAACRAEVEVNRRTAPALYLGVAPILRRDGRFVLGALGEEAVDAADWLVVMRRFDQDQLFDRLATRGALTPALIDAVTDRIAAFHGAAVPRPATGGAAALRALLEASLAELTAVPGGVAPERIAAVAQVTRAAHDRAAGILDRRAVDGRVRHCHGDLHLRNICLIEGEPTLFDAIEFSDEIAVVDVLYDLGFLVMDLLHRRLPALANQVINRYLEQLDEFDGTPAFGFMLALRALVRAKIEATLATEATDEARAAHRAEAEALLSLACDCATPGRARLIALGGLSGSGKSTVARGLAPLIGRPPGALIVRSDVVRKQLAGVAPQTRLGAAAYGPEQTARIYAELRRRAALALEAGVSVVVDAVHARPDERRAIAAAAQGLGVAFQGVWLEAAPDRLMARVGGRRADASDATDDVVRQQLGYELGPLDWPVLDASGSIDETVARARAVVG